MSTPDQIGPYRILGELGRGGMGAVYRARREDLGRDFALKVVLGEYAEQPAAIARLRREAQAAAKLAAHPGIAGVHDLGEDPATGQLYVAMEFCAGGSLTDRLERRELSAHDLLEVAADCAAALTHAHHAGLLHRDIKPDNILFDGQGRARLGDFGLVGELRTDADTERLTRTGVVLGTPAYMPPEQLRGETLGPDADLWALGATMYEALLGAPPFGDGSVIEVAGAVLRRAVTPPRARDPRISRSLDAIVMRCLERDVAQRYADAAALEADLRACREGRRIAPETLRLRAQAGRRRRGRRAGAAVGVVTVLGTGLAIWVWTAGQERVQQRHEHSLVKQAVDTAEIEARSAYALRCSAAYAELIATSLPAMRRLEDRSHGVETEPAAVADALAHVESAADTVAKTFPGVDVPSAWRALARDFAARDSQALRAMPPEYRDPISNALGALPALHSYVEAGLLWRMQNRDGRIRVTRSVESATAIALRERAHEVIARATRSDLWEWLSEGRDFGAFADGVAALSARDWSEARGRFAAAQENAVAGDLAKVYLSNALQMGGDAAGAARAASAVSDRGWVRIIDAVAHGWFAAALDHAPGSAERTHMLEVALTQAERLTHRRLMWPQTAGLVALICGELAKTPGMPTAESDDVLQRAMPPLERAAREWPTEQVAHANLLALAESHLQFRQAFKLDADAVRRRLIDHCGRAAVALPKWDFPRAKRAELLYQGSVRAASLDERIAMLAQAAADCATCTNDMHDTAGVRLTHALALHDLAGARQRRDAAEDVAPIRRAALVPLQRYLTRHPGHEIARYYRAHLTWQLALVELDAAPARGTMLRAALEDFEAVVALRRPGGRVRGIHFRDLATVYRQMGEWLEATGAPDEAPAAYERSEAAAVEAGNHPGPDAAHDRWLIWNARLQRARLAGIAALRARVAELTLIVAELSQKDVQQLADLVDNLRQRIWDSPIQVEFGVMGCRFYDPLVARFVGSPELRHDRGYMRWSAGDGGGALADWERALELAPADWWLRTRTVEELEGYGWQGHGVAPAAWVTLARTAYLRMEVGDIAGARGAFDIALHALPADWDRWEAGVLKSFARDTHYTAAWVYAALHAGRADYHGAVRVPAAADRAVLRDRCFALLPKAKGLHRITSELMRSDEEFGTLAEDPRWEPLLQGW